MNNVLKVEWFLSNSCNFNCNYCPPNFKDGTLLHPNIEALENAFANLSKESDKFDSLVLQLNGGEPTSCESLRLIMAKDLYPKIKFKLVSNGSAELDWWRSVKEQVSHLDLTYHLDADLDHFKQVVDIILTVHRMISIRIAFLPDRWDECWHAYQELKQCLVGAEMQMLYSNLSKGSNQYLDYSIEQWDIYFTENNIVKPEESKENKKIQRLNDYYGHLCWAGVDQIVIDYYGDVFRGWCKSNAPMGNVYRGTFEMNPKPLPCPKAQCGNGFDQQARKSDKSWGMT